MKSMQVIFGPDGAVESASFFVDGSEVAEAEFAAAPDPQQELVDAVSSLTFEVAMLKFQLGGA